MYKRRLDTLTPNDFAPNTSDFANGKIRRTYYSSNQGLLFIGPYLVDEVVQCEYALTQTKVPIYGYASQYYDKLAEGKVLVNGSFTINYVDSFYLSEALIGVVKQLYNQSIAQSPLYNNADRRATEEAEKLMQRLNELYQNGVNTTNTRVTKQITQMIASNPRASSAIIRELKERYWDKRTDEAINASYARNIKLGAVGSKEADDASNFFDGRRPDQFPAFDISVIHGDPTFNPSYRILRAVEITGVRQIIAPSGQPQLESYSFLCRSIDF